MKTQPCRIEETHPAPSAPTAVFLPHSARELAHLGPQGAGPLGTLTGSQAEGQARP